MFEDIISYVFYFFEKYARIFTYISFSYVKNTLTTICRYNTAIVILNETKTIVCLFHCFNSCLCPGCSIITCVSYICLLMFVYTMAAFSIHLQRTKTSKQSFNADGNRKITTKGHLLQCRLGTLHLAEGARHPQETQNFTVVGHLFGELFFFELSHIYLAHVSYAYHTRILFFEKYVRILTYFILSYAYPRTLRDIQSMDDDNRFDGYIILRLRRQHSGFDASAKRQGGRHQAPAATSQ